MTRDEVKKLFYMLMSVFPNFHNKDDDDMLRMAIDGWAVALSDYTADFINSGIKVLMQKQVYSIVPADVINAAQASGLDPLELQALSDAEYRRLNPDWMHDGRSCIQRAKWLEQNNALESGASPNRIT